MGRILAEREFYERLESVKENIVRIRKQVDAQRTVLARHSTVPKNPPSKPTFRSTAFSTVPRR